MWAAARDDEDGCAGVGKGPRVEGREQDGHVGVPWHGDARRGREGVVEVVENPEHLLGPQTVQDGFHSRLDRRGLEGVGSLGPETSGDVR